jgi:3-deoxy-7-phosphoheptulonate synthase
MIGAGAEKYKEVFEAMDAVEHVNEIQKPYKLASREFKRENTVVNVSRNIDIGGKKIHVMAGPCAIESKSLMNDTGNIVKEAGGTILRGGAFKPRSSPYAFQGLGEEGLKYMEEIGKKLHMPTISEAIGRELLN